MAQVKLQQKQQRQQHEQVKQQPQQEQKQNSVLGKKAKMQSLRDLRPHRGRSTVTAEPWAGQGLRKWCEGYRGIRSMVQAAYGT